MRTQIFFKISHDTIVYENAERNEQKKKREKNDGRKMQSSSGIMAEAHTFFFIQTAYIGLFLTH